VLRLARAVDDPFVSSAHGRPTTAPPGHAQHVRSGWAGEPGGAEHRVLLPLPVSVASGRHQVVAQPKPGVDDGEDGDDHNKAEEDAGPKESAPSFPAANHAGTAFPVGFGS